MPLLLYLPFRQPSTIPHSFNLSVSEVCDASILVPVTLNLISKFGRTHRFTFLSYSLHEAPWGRVVVVPHDVLRAPSIDLHVP